MISEGGTDEETAIYQLDLSLCKPTHTYSLHTLTPRKGRSWPFFLISPLYRKNPETFASDVPSVHWKSIRLHASESSRAGRWGSQNYKKLTKFTAKLQGIELFTCDWLGNVLIACVLPHAWAPWSHQIQSLTQQLECEILRILLLLAHNEADSFSVKWMINKTWNWHAFIYSY